MALFGKPQKLDLVPGHLYRVLKNYKSWSDSFAPGEELIYLNSAFSPYDSAYGFFFHDTKSGGARRIDTADSDKEETLQELKDVLEDCGLDMKSGAFEPGAGVATSNYECLFPHSAYCKELVEGKTGIKSWFVWLEENGELLNSNFTRAALLRIKYDGFATAKHVLDLSGETYQESPRYAWISRIHSR